MCDIFVFYDTGFHCFVYSHVIFPAFVLYRQCHSWVEEVTSSLSSQPLASPVDKHFVSGIHLGVGVFNVVSIN